jgi:hypothetical protein
MECHNCAYNYYNPGINPYNQHPCMRTAPMYRYPATYEDTRLPDSWSFGPLKVEWNFDGESINVIFKMFEDAVKDVVLSLSKPTVTINLTLGDSTVNLKVNADFTQKYVSISGSVCFDTICTTFNNTVVAKW